MLKKLPAKTILAIVIVAALVGIELFLHAPIFSNAKDKVYDLLHHKRITINNDSIKITSSDFLKKYYDIFGYKKNFTDTTHQNDKYRVMLIDMLNHADSLGLERADYHPDYIRRFDSLSHKPGFDYTKFESENELIFTDAALSFLYHVAYGKEINIGFNGVKYNIDSSKIVNVFNDLLAHGDWRRALDSLEPQTKQYLGLKTELNRMQALLHRQPELDSLAPVSLNSSSNEIVQKLKAYDVVDDSLLSDSISTSAYIAGIKAFQRMMSVDTTGKLDNKTIAFLNFSLSKRIQQIKESLNYWRWTGRMKDREFILINIPAARLQIVKRDSTTDLSMKVIVGKTTTQTPQFTAYINKIIAYPYWTVPLDIATKEMLPKIKKNISYLEENNLQVLNGKGVEVDPAGINWKKLSEHYFPYTIRQSTGCDNSLGVLKFDLNSPYSIYLHDTNAKALFGKKERFLSHGCIRLEKPMLLAEYILSEGLDTASIAKLNACLANQQQSEFKLKKRFAVLIFYMTADIDNNGNLKFYNDVYGVEEKKPLVES